MGSTHRQGQDAPGRISPFFARDRHRCHKRGRAGLARGREGSQMASNQKIRPGRRIVATLAKLLRERGSGRGLISVCTAGGMGVTAILEAA